MYRKLCFLLALVILSLSVGTYLGLSLVEPSLETSISVEKDDTLKQPKESEIVKLNNQFVVPVLRNGKVSSLVIISLSVETAEGAREEIFLLEPKLRDVLLSTLFDHANSGYFSTDFTERMKLDALRISLREAAATILKNPVHSVLITDLVRQDSI